MVHYYTYEYGMVSKSDALHVYCSRDRLIGLVVRILKEGGVWGPGKSLFFVWEQGPGGAEFDTEKEARQAAERPSAPGLPSVFGAGQDGLPGDYPMAGECR